MFTDLFCYFKKLLYSPMLALQRFCQNAFLSYLKRIILPPRHYCIYIDVREFSERSELGEKSLVAAYKTERFVKKKIQMSA